MQGSLAATAAGEIRAGYRIGYVENTEAAASAGGDDRDDLDRQGEVMFDKIVWATDGSTPAEKALPYAKELAAAAGDGASLVVVHAVETFAGSRAAGLPLNADERELRGKIEGQVRDLESEGLSVESRFLTESGPHAAHAIAEAAREAGADVIVAGTRGQTPLGGLVLGSVAQGLLHIAPCPVLVVPDKAAA